MAYMFQACCLLLIFGTHSAYTLACHPANTITLDGDLTPSGDLKAGGYVFTPNYYQAINKTHFNVCICSVAKCIQKCCDIGMSYNYSSKCAPNNKPTEFDIYDDQLRKTTSDPSTIFQLIHGDLCKDKYQLEPNESESDLYYLLTNGQLYLPNFPKGDQNLSWDIFCVENNHVGNEVRQVVLVCFQEEQVQQVSSAYPVGVIISIPFLIITLLVYAVLPDLRNLNGKNLMCQVSSMIVAYSFLAALQLSSHEISYTLCVTSAYVMEYAFMATFFWLNVTSYDLWWTFGGFGGILMTRHHDTLKFAFYSLYAWGGPLILIGITLGLDMSPNLPSYIIKPRMGESKCWFHNEKALFSYFYGPIAVILTINMVFFAMTAYKIFAVSKEANQMLHGENSRRSSEATKQKFFLYLKLFFVMGVNWIMEVVSAAHDSTVYKYIFIATDICNAFQGIFIFLIFVYNKRTKRKLLSRLGFKQEGETNTTATTYSSRHSSMMMTSRGVDDKLPNIIDPNRKVSLNPAEVPNGAG